MAILNKLQALTIRKKVCLTILLIYVLIAIFAPALMPFEVTDFSHPSLATPDKTYLLGTDEMGHDIFSMLIHGFRLIAGHIPCGIAGSQCIFAAESINCEVLGKESVHQRHGQRRSFHGLQPVA